MQESKSFEKTVSFKLYNDLLKRQAVRSRDLANLTESNQKCTFLFKSIILFLLFLSVCIAIPTLCSMRFSSVMEPLQNCKVQVNDAADCFNAFCKICHQGFNLREGRCFSAV